MVILGEVKKHKLNQQNVNLTKIGGNFKFLWGEIRKKFVIFWEVVEYAICIIGLGGWMPLTT